MYTQNMPVKYEEYFNEEFGLDVTSSEIATTAPPISEFLLSDDIWKKVESECSELFRTTYFDEFLRELTFDEPLDSLFAQVEQEERQQGITCPSAFDLSATCVDQVMLHNHDCMWAGHCGSSEHPVDEIKQEPKDLSPLMTGAYASAPVACTPLSGVAGSPVASTAGGQQSLLKPSLRSAGLPIINMIAPQTPPMSDDEDKHHIKQTQVLKIFPQPEDLDDDDTDLCEYLGAKLDPDDDDADQQQNEEEDDSSSSASSSSSSSSSSESEESDDEKDEPQPGPSTSCPTYAFPSQVTSIRSNVYATENDHSYHKDKNASMRMVNLGIDTPSDSEEEIDVVSVTDKKYTAASRMSHALPTNPSISDRRHFQRTMDAAMNTGRRINKNNNGLKIMLPAKRPATSSPPNCPPAKTKAVPQNDNRGNKRAKQYRMTNARPYRKRTNYNDSESEPEPSEKRSLHNNMERQRRIDLRNAFEYLRQLVPEVLKKERAAKVVILREAAKYCDSLTYNSMSMNKQVEDLKRHQERLRMRVSMLRRNLAQKR